MSEDVRSEGTSLLSFHRLTGDRGDGLHPEVFAALYRSQVRGAAASGSETLSTARVAEIVDLAAYRTHVARR